MVNPRLISTGSTLLRPQVFLPNQSQHQFEEASTTDVRKAAIPEEVCPLLKLGETWLCDVDYLFEIYSIWKYLFEYLFNLKFEFDILTYLNLIKICPRQ